MCDTRMGIGKGSGLKHWSGSQKMFGIELEEVSGGEQMDVSKTKGTRGGLLG